MFMRLPVIASGLLALVAINGGWLAAQPAVHPISAAESYLPEELVRGTLQLVGSRTMSQLAAVWADGFRHVQTGVEVRLAFQGSETAFSQLDDQAAAIGLLSRELTQDEKKTFGDTHPGLKLLAVDAAYDAIAVVVHPENPIAGLSLKQLQTLYCQDEQASSLTWKSVELEDEWADVPVVRFAPDEQSGARGQFFSRVLGADGQPAMLTAYSWHTKIVEEVAANRGAIGFVNRANAHTDKVRTVPLAAENGGAFVTLSSESIASGEYPLIRPLSLIVIMEDAGVRNPLVAEFLRYVLSSNGQEDVIKDGFQPLGRAALLEQIDHLGWTRVK
jgi:phosphate transport system substrate-binding protein